MKLVELDGLTGKMAQSIQCVPCKHEALSLNPSIHISTQTWDARTISALERLRQVAPWGFMASQPIFYFASLMCQRIQKTGYIAPEEEHPRLTFGLYVHAQTCMCTKYTYAPIHTHKRVELRIRVLNKISQVRRQIFHFLSYVEPRFYIHTHTHTHYEKMEV